MSGASYTGYFPIDRDDELIASSKQEENFSASCLLLFLAIEFVSRSRPNDAAQ
jgi:hypothetical protein